MNEQITDSIAKLQMDSIPEKSLDTAANNIPDSLKVDIIEHSEKIEWNIWFLLIAVLTLIAAVIIPFAQKKYEERKSKIGFHIYVKKKLGIVWNLLTYDKYEYKMPKSADSMQKVILTFDKLINKFEKDFKENKNTIHPLFAFGVLYNLQNLLFAVSRIQDALNTIDIKNLDEKHIRLVD